jgi:hypothetical protein
VGYQYAPAVFAMFHSLSVRLVLKRLERRMLARWLVAAQPWRWLAVQAVAQAEAKSGESSSPETGVSRVDINEKIDINDFDLLKVRKRAGLSMAADDI